jgi:hypothetical protein
MTTVSNSGTSSTGATALFAPFCPDHLPDFVYKNGTIESLLADDDDLDDGLCCGGFESAYDSFPDLTS